MKGTT
ncbi:nicotianamine aminotransferase1 [Zea mays]